MRIYLYTALTVATFGLLTLAPANAAGAWSCMGPYVACGSAHSAPKKSSHRSRGALPTVGSVASASHSLPPVAIALSGATPRPATCGGLRRAAYHASNHRVASYYGQGRDGFGRALQRRMTAAHRCCPSAPVRVTQAQRRSVDINDRGPFIRGRIIDLSTGAAGVIGMRAPASPC
jgi:rare lipoprotein A (peptidoglycan hydrolase)